MNSTKLPVSELLEKLVQQHTSPKITFNDIRNALKESGFCLLMIIFGFPAALPLPYPPGFTTLLGIPLALFAIQMLLNVSSPWLPNWLEKKSISYNLLQMVVARAVPLLHKAEKYIKPRFSFTDTLLGEKLVALFFLACAIMISLPIPFGHMVPGIAVLLMALGMLDRDGVTVMAGMALTVVGLIADIVIVAIEWEALVDLFWFVDSHARQL